MEHLDSPFIGTIITVLQDMDANHQTNRFSLAAQVAVIGTQCIVQTIPVDQSGGTKQLMFRIEDIRKQGLEHKKLPFWQYVLSYQVLIAYSPRIINPESTIFFSFQRTGSVFMRLLTRIFQGGLSKKWKRFKIVQ